jgi:plastocyanin
MMRWVAALLLIPSAALAGTVSLVVGPAAPIPSMDPTTVLTGDVLPLGACARLAVVDGDRPLEISNIDDDLRLGVTVGGAPDFTVTEQNLTEHLLGQNEYSDTQLEAADLNFDGEVDVADLVELLFYPGNALFVGGDPQALVVARPDGAGALDDVSVTGALGPKLVEHDGSFADFFSVVVVDNVMSLTPDLLEVRPGDTVTIALQIDSAVGTGHTLGYTAQIEWDGSLTALGTVSGAEDNEDFSSAPGFTFDGNHVDLDALLTSRTDVGESVINVANIPLTVSSSAQPGDLIGVLIDSAHVTLVPQIGAPLVAPEVRVIGCAVRVVAP